MTTTAPGSANAWTRAAMLGASPKISPAASTTTAPQSTPMRATRFGPGASVLEVQFPASLRWMARCAARNRAFAIVLLRNRVAKQRHAQPVAELLGDASAHLRHRLRGGVEVGAEQIALQTSMSRAVAASAVEPTRSQNKGDRDRAAFSVKVNRTAAPRARAAGRLADFPGR